jgi:osmotically-inducible protein OsmY
MKQSFVGVVLALLLLAVGPVALPAGAADVVPQAVQDAAITGRIESMYLLNEHLNPFNINTTTQGGVVTLSGSVSDEIQRELAEELAKSVDGVERVENKLTVAEVVIDSTPKRTWRERVDDLSVSASIRTRLISHKHFKGLTISVKTERRIVTLFGVVRSEEQKNHIGDIAFDTRGVEKVNNFLTVQPKESNDDPVLYVGGTISDEWVEKRIETAILINRHVSIRSLDVEVNDGICVLAGVVATDSQRQLAGSIADNIQGVKTVRNAIQVRQQDIVTGPVEAGLPPLPPEAPIAEPEAEPAEAEPEVVIVEDAPGALPKGNPPAPPIEPYLPKVPVEDSLLTDP